MSNEAEKLLADFSDSSLHAEIQRIQNTSFDPGEYLKVLRDELARREVSREGRAKQILQETWDWVTSQHYPVPVELSKKIADVLGGEMTTLGVVLERQRESDADQGKLAECSCNFNRAWIGFCGQPVAPGSTKCEDHKGITCYVCGMQATRECDHSGQFVCGTPLCDDCEGFVSKGVGYMNTQHGHRAKAVPPAQPAA